jgi:hypothetical protein
MAWIHYSGHIALWCLIYRVGLHMLYMWTFEMTKWGMETFFKQWRSSSLRSCCPESKAAWPRRSGSVAVCQRRSSNGAVSLRFFYYYHHVRNSNQLVQLRGCLWNFLRWTNMRADLNMLTWVMTIPSNYYKTNVCSNTVAIDC